MQSILRPDPNDKTIIAARWEDVEPALEQNKTLRTMEQPSDWGRHIAAVPNIILDKWLIEEWDRGNKALRLHSEEFNLIVARKLQDPDWAYLRADKHNPTVGYRKWQ